KRNAAHLISRSPGAGRHEVAEMPDKSNDSAVRVRIAAWQGRCVDGDVAANLQAAGRAIDAAAEERAEFLCLPEAFLSGYGSREIVERGALSLDDPRLAELASAAASRNLVLLVGLSERLANGDLGNT